MINYFLYYLQKKYIDKE